MLAALFTEAPAVPFSLLTVSSVGQRALAADRRVLALGVEVILPRRDASAYYIDLAESRPREIPFLDWPTFAACKGKEEALFFREDNDASATRRRSFSESRKVCLSCPVIEDCLRHALRKPEEFGVWGGTHGVQRKAMLARIAAGETTLEWEVRQCLR